MNFDPELLEIACECRNLEQLGYHIPELTRNLALQLDKYVGAQYKLQMMVDKYHLLLDSLNAAEVVNSNQPARTYQHKLCHCG